MTSNKCHVCGETLRENDLVGSWEYGFDINYHFCYKCAEWITTDLDSKACVFQRIVNASSGKEKGS